MQRQEMILDMSYKNFQWEKGKNNRIKSEWIMRAMNCVYVSVCFDISSLLYF